MNKWYILDENNNPIESTIEEFSKLSKEKRRVDWTSINGTNISTVFLGLDHSWTDDKILVFETMVFDGDLDGEMERYSTYEEAKLGHQIIVDKVKNYKPL